MGELERHIALKLTEGESAFAEAWRGSAPVQHFVVHDLLPDKLAREISAAFPSIEKLDRLDSLRERKSVGVRMNEYYPLIKEITFAFQNREVLDIVSRITGILQLAPDANLYNSGISEMKEGDYLHPHIDNSSNPFLRQYRRINALYYVSEDWDASCGGNLELWDKERKNPVQIPYRFNSVVFMNTNRHSFHSVDPLHGCGTAVRKCVSNYYFSPVSPDGREYFHVTTFRARPEQPVRDLVLKMDGMLRNLLRKLKPRKPEQITHVYRSKEE